MRLYPQQFVLANFRIVPIFFWTLSALGQANLVPEARAEKRGRRVLIVGCVPTVARFSPQLASRLLLDGHTDIEEQWRIFRLSEGCGLIARLGSSFLSYFRHVKIDRQENIINTRAHRFRTADECDHFCCLGSVNLGPRVS